jgi:hypothetical protein
VIYDYFYPDSVLQTSYSPLDDHSTQLQPVTDDPNYGGNDPASVRDFQSTISTHQTTRNIGSSSAPAQYAQYSMTEDDAHIQTVYRMSEVDNTFSTPSSLASNPNAGHQIIEYYSELNALAVLGESLGQRRRKRLVQIDLPGPAATLSARDRELSHLDSIDQQYLRDRGIYDLPSRQIWYDHRFFLSLLGNITH